MSQLKKIQSQVSFSTDEGPDDDAFIYEDASFCPSSVCPVAIRGWQTDVKVTPFVLPTCIFSFVSLKEKIKK